ncbi:MAG TPA: prolyl oligopeptidase family serine peptidase [Candidatus Binataceae bacterium]|nr:prolyl oligopeptidase family serine peptidase [Candidatus Binataceae bacterium]
MRTRKALLPFLLFAALALTAHAPLADSPDKGDAIHVRGGPWTLAARVFKSEHLSARPHLIVVLHGDAPGVNPTYQYNFAHEAASSIDDAIVVALMRPGYADGKGLASEGNIGWKLGDNYTSDRIESIVDAARALLKQYDASDLTLVGHSGGAAISADILGLYPGVATRALLVSCPCDVPAFRWSMIKFQWNPLWLIPVSSVSPQNEVSAIPKSTRVRMVVGANDPVTPEPLTLAFARALRARGVPVTVTILPKLGHEILLEPATLDQLKDLMRGA